MKKILQTSSTFKHHDDTYDICSLSRGGTKLIINKSTRFGINYYDVSETQITRVLSKKKTIKLANHILDLSEMAGIKEL